MLPSTSRIPSPTTQTMAPPAATETTALDELLTSTLALLSQFTTSLAAPTTPTVPLSSPPVPLEVLRDAARLLKAHTTKISLLAINTPFTPRAIRSIVHDLSTTCLPAMLSAVQLLTAHAHMHGALLAREAHARVRRVFTEMAMLLAEVQGVARGEGRAQGRRRDSLASTGVVWESCEALVELHRLGLAGLAVQKAEQYRETIRDAIAEIHEWVEGEDTETEGRDVLLDEEDEGVEGDRDSFEDVFHAANSMPKDRPELRALVAEAEGKLKKIVLLYTAVIKRRLKTFRGVQADGVAALDESLQGLRRIPHQIDELASLFYDLDEAHAIEMVAACIAEAKQAGSAVLLNWEKQEDEYSAWYRKWEEAIGD